MGPWQVDQAQPSLGAYVLDLNTQEAKTLG